MSVLLIHKRNAIDCYFQDREGVLTIALPKEALFDTDIRSEQVYQQAIGKAIGSKSTPSTPAILVMADEVCYVTQAKTDEVEEKTKDLVTDTPFAHVETATLQAQNLVYVIAANADLYDAAVRAFHVMGYTIGLVVPWGALVFYKLIVAGKIDQSTVKGIFDAQSQLMHTGFPLATHDPIDVSSGVEKNNKKKPKIPVGWIIFIACAVIYAIGMIWFLARR